MKRSFQIFSTIVLLMFGIFIRSLAQSDDVYYDPNRDNGNHNSQNDNGNNNQQQPPLQQNNRTDGYNNNNNGNSDNSNPAYRYDDGSNNNNYNHSNNSNGTYDDVYASDAVAYDDDDDSYYYTTHLNRYYTPNYGVNYHSYWFTPSYYNGWDSWNSPYVASYSPWYGDPWCRWHLRHRVIVYDPFYDPYWDWNWGWNSTAYYNSWYTPFYGFGFTTCSFYGWGYNSWGFNNYGYGGGYYNGYNSGYWNGYNNGYWNGYYDGYNHGYYGNTAYNNNGYGNGYYYYGPRRHKDAPMPKSNPIPAATVSAATNHPIGGSRVNAPVNRVAPNTHPAEIPREGVTKPFVPAQTHAADRNPVNVQAEKPYDNHKPEVMVKPNDANKIGENPRSVQPNHPAPERENNWNTVPPDKWSNRTQPRENYQNPNVNREQPPVQQHINPAPRENYNSQPRQEPRNEQPRYQEPRNNNLEPRQQYEQPRQQPRNEQPRQYEQPRSAPQQRSNFQSAPQRSYSPAPSHSSGGNPSGGNRSSSSGGGGHGGRH